MGFCCKFTFIKTKVVWILTRIYELLNIYKTQVICHYRKKTQVKYVHHTFVPTVNAHTPIFMLYGL